jgi:antitoxin VapB
MSMVHLSQDAELLARRIAAARGISLEEAVQLAIEQGSKTIGTAAPPAARPAKEDLIRRMEEISARCGARPLIDPRSPDELLGYDDYGLPG